MSDEKKMTYRPRNDFVVLRRMEIGKIKGFWMPGMSRMGKKLIVQAIGPKVEDLKVGDVVEAIGEPGQDIVTLPNETDLFITKEANVLCVVTQEDIVSE